MALGVPGRLRPRIFSTFDTTRVVGRQPNEPAVFTSGEIPGTHFQRLSRPQDARFCRKEPRKKFQVSPPGIDPGTVRLVVQRLNHYAAPGPTKRKAIEVIIIIIIIIMLIIIIIIIIVSQICCSINFCNTKAYNFYPDPLVLGKHSTTSRFLC